jgi:RNA polymerase sigma-70 factor (ECF subfamily)
MPPAIAAAESLSFQLCQSAGWRVFMMEKFEELYRQHVQAVFRFALHCVGRRDVAEDLTAEAFLALYQNLDAIDVAQLPGWLITVTRNRARDFWRRRSVEQKYAVAAPDPPAASEPALDSWLLESDELKPVHRLCLTLRYVHGMTRTEIAEKSGLTEMQVKGHLQYALQLLRKLLDKGTKS